MTATGATDFFARTVRERLFVPRSEECQSVGLEIELLPRLAESGLPCPLGWTETTSPSTLAFVRQYGLRAGWHEEQSPKGAPYFTLPDGGMLTFEPGGQIELCTRPRRSVGELLGETRATLRALRRAAADAGIDLASEGIDARNDISTIPLQIEGERYVRMTRYFERVGRSGVRMMRQTAATQVSLDGGCDPGARWRLLCDLTPYLTAIFANSPRYAGADTGFVSFRQRCWRLLDPSRTGVPEVHASACADYTQFALDAVDMWRTDGEGCYRPFGDWVAGSEWNEAQWESHLSTLFPEVRPRGHLEVRSIDALPEEILGAPVILLAGLVYDPEIAAEARRLLGPADEQILNLAAQRGMNDRHLAETAVDLVTLGVQGARALGEGMIAGEELERATQFFRDFTLQRRSPADDR